MKLIFEIQKKISWKFETIKIPVLGFSFDLIRADI